MKILGLNIGHADAAAVLLIDGRLVAAIQEERMNHVKHSAGFPEASIRACLEQGGISVGALDHIAVASKPIAHMEDDILFALAGRSTYGSALRERLERVARFLDLKGELSRRLDTPVDDIGAIVHEVEHHGAHLAAAFLPRGAAAEGQAALSLDTFGDYASTLFGIISDGEMAVHGKVLYPHSLGILYTMFCQYLGLGQFGSEGKLMGLAAHGKPSYREHIDRLFRWKANGTFTLDLSYFTHHLRGLDMTWDGPNPTIEKISSDAMVEVFGPPRRLGEAISQQHMDIAASVQAAVSDFVVQLADRLQAGTGASTLYFAGKLAENALLASTIRERSRFQNVECSFASGDAGTALGAALLVHNRVGGDPLVEQPLPWCGTTATDAEIERCLRDRDIDFDFTRDPVASAVDLLAEQKVVGWFQGAMEFGPRALGNRSILADPRSEEMREHMNSRIKFREVFLPFAASIRAENAADLIADPAPSPWMQFVGRLRPDVAGSLPAVTHVDGTVRYQTVGPEAPRRFVELLDAWHVRTGCPALLNTSLNENGPIVRTPDEAIHCLAATGMDALVIGSYVARAR